MKTKQITTKYKKFIDISSLCWICLNMFKISAWKNLELVFLKYYFVLKFSYLYTMPFLKGALSRYCDIIIKQNDISNLKIKNLCYLNTVVVTLYKKEITYLWRKIKAYYYFENISDKCLNKRIFILKSNVGSGKLYFLKVFIKLHKSLLIIFEKSIQNYQIINVTILKVFNNIRISHNKDILLYFSNFKSAVYIYTEICKFFKLHIRDQQMLTNLFYFLDITQLKSTALEHILSKNLTTIMFTNNINHEIIQFFSKKKTYNETFKLLEHYDIFRKKKSNNFYNLIFAALYLEHNTNLNLYCNSLLIKDTGENNFLLDNEKLKPLILRKRFFTYNMKLFQCLVLDLNQKLNFFKKFLLLDVRINSFLIIGPEGSGKSIFLKYLSSIMNFKYVTIHFRNNVRKEMYFKKLSHILFFLKNKICDNLVLFIKNIESSFNDAQNMKTDVILTIKNCILNLRIPFIISFKYRFNNQNLFKEFINLSKLKFEYLDFNKKKYLFCNILLAHSSHKSTISKYTKKLVISNYSYLFYKYFLAINSRYFKLFKDILIRKDNITFLIKKGTLYKLTFLQKLLIQKIIRNYHRFKH